MKKLLLLGTALVAFADAGLAADLGPYRPGSIKDEPVPIYAPVFSWTGFYVGAQVGYGWGDSDFTDLITGDRFTFEQDGWFGGGFVGFNWQKDRFVFGIEGDANGADFSDSAVSGGPAPFKLESNVDALYSIRGRIGLAHDRWLLFATGGWAWANVQNEYTDLAGRITDDDTVDGWTAGAGLEYAFTPNWTARVEYRHYDFGDHVISSGFKQDLDLDTVSVGVAYKF